ncbi:MAG: NAD(P)/FAD-dependent oxidoreductase [Thermomicrobiales bacterium]
MPDVVVVGGGIIGASLAFSLQQMKASVTLVDAGHDYNSATRASFAWLNANAKTPRSYFDLNKAGMEEHRRLSDLLGSRSTVRWSGNTEWATTVEGRLRLNEKVARLRSWGYSAEFLPIGRLISIEPFLQPPAGVDEFAWFQDEGYVDAPALTSALIDLASEGGATILHETEVATLRESGGRITGVKLTTGSTLESDHLVVCAGNDSAGLISTAGLELPLAPVVGMVAISSAVTEGLHAVHHDETMHIRPVAGERIMMRHTDFDTEVEPGERPSRKVLDALRNRVTSVLPSVAHAIIDESYVAARPIPADGHPVAGSTGVDGLSLIVTHSGATMGPLLGRLVAEEILQGELSELLEPFRPDRLLTHR